MYPASVEYLNRPKNHPKIKAVDIGSNDIYIFFPFSLFVSVYVYASVCDFVCTVLLLPFVLGSACSFFVFSIVFSTGYHWWICFSVLLLSSFFLFLFFFFYYFLIF